MRKRDGLKGFQMRVNIQSTCVLETVQCAAHKVHVISMGFVKMSSRVFHKHTKMTIMAILVKTKKSNNKILPY